MSICSKCGSSVPETAKFCPVCGAAVEEAPSVDSAPASGAEYAYEAPAAAPVYEPAKPAIGSIFDFYGKAFAILAKKPIRLWALSLLFLVIAGIVSSLGAMVPIISLPIILVLALGFTGVLLDGYHGKDVRSEQLFQGFKKDEVVRNGAGMCWMGLWTMIWGMVPVMNIIKSYAYSFVPYIMLTDKEITATEALRKSMRMTNGYKGKMFLADFLISVGLMIAAGLLTALAQIRYIGFLFGIILFALYLASFLFLPIFYGLVRTAFFEEISAVYKGE